MRRKRIAGVLRKKFDEWASTIEDSATRKLVMKNSIITGGCITSLLLDEKINDIDIYFSNDATVSAVCRYYVERFQYDTECKVFSLGLESNDRLFIRIPSEGVAKHVRTEDEKDKTHIPIVITENAITLSDDIQLIVRFTGNVEEIHSNFDFVHCTCVWSSADEKLILPSDALESILAKELRYTGSKYPLSSVIRTRKFIGRGWKISGGEYLKMCFQISELNLKNVNVLREQLIGVDTTYFAQLISRIGERDITNLYIVELVDEIFN